MEIEKLSEAEAIQDWSDEDYDDVFCNFHNYETKKQAKKIPSKNKAKPNKVGGVKVKMLCHCGNKYLARKVDLLRGWGLSCSKSCAALRREFGKPAAKIVGE